MTCLLTYLNRGGTYVKSIKYAITTGLHHKKNEINPERINTRLSHFA